MAFLLGAIHREYTCVLPMEEKLDKLTDLVKDIKVDVTALQMDQHRLQDELDFLAARCKKDDLGDTQSDNSDQGKTAPHKDLPLSDNIGLDKSYVPQTQQPQFLHNRGSQTRGKNNYCEPVRI